MAVSAPKKNFGQGLESILGATSITLTDEGNPKRSLLTVMVQQLQPGKFQPRRVFDQVALKELSNSIAEQGVLQPIVARKIGKNEYEIIAGERRWRAAQMAGLQQVPIVTCDISDESALAFGLIENIQRQDLNPIEEAFALKRLLDEFNMTHDKVAKSIGRSRASVSNMLRLLNLTPLVQEYLINKKIDTGHAKMLLVFSPDEQIEIASIIIEKKMTVRQAEKYVQNKKLKDHDLNKNVRKSSQPHPKSEEWERQLSKKLATDVSVKVSSVGQGSVVIKVASLDEVECLIDML